MITDWQLLVDALRKEVEEYGGLLNLFDRQQSALLRRDADTVLATVGAIEQQIKTIDQCRNARESVMRLYCQRLGLAADLPLRGLLEYFPAPVQPLVDALIGEVNSLIMRSKRRAQQNQMLLARSIEVTQQILQRLNPSGVTKTYTAKGRVSVGITEGETRCIAEG